MADAAMYAPQDEEEQALVEAVVAPSTGEGMHNRSHSQSVTRGQGQGQGQSQSHSHGHSHSHGEGCSHSHGQEAAVPAFGTPFHADIPTEAASPRVVGEWVHPQERALREWYSLDCTCGSRITFPWLGFQVVSCPTCGSHVSSEKAVFAPVPGASVQAQAKEDEERLSALVNSEVRRDAAAKKFVERFSFLRRRVDALERCFFGKETRYGRFKMYMNGKIILAPTSSYCIIPPMIVLPAIVSMMMVPSIPQLWVQVVSAILVVAFVAITMAHFTEPGILRKGLPGPVQQDIYEEVNGFNTTKKWCHSCNCYRSARASHCSECDVCVERFDHHCHITGTCVGVRNFKPFVVFVFGIALADVIGFISFCLRLSYWHPTPLEKAHRWHYLGITIFGLLWTLVTSQLMMNMAFAIFFMSSRGITTRELVKRLWDPENNPWDKGSKWANIKEFLFTATPPSHIWGLSEGELESLNRDDQI